MNVTAILVTHNSEAVIEHALRSLYGHPRIGQCIVVDNASGDNSVEIIRSQFPRVHLITNEKNIGFGLACNQALALVQTEFTLLINPDASVAAEGIELLVHGFSAHPKAAIIGPGDAAGEVEFVSGAIMMWRMAFMREVGFFDPAFFLFYEDDDICMRVRKAGYTLVLLSGIHFSHKPGTSCQINSALASLKLQSSVWSSFYFKQKYQGRLVATFAALVALARAVLVLCFVPADQPDSNMFEQRLMQAIKEKPKQRERLVHMHERAWAKAVRRAEAKDRLRAAVAFLRNQKRFLYDC